MNTKNEELAHFKRALEEKGLKCTHERKCIYDEILNLGDHFDADSLYDRFKKRGLRISRATVYRTIPLLLESGVIQKSAGEGKRDFFERVRQNKHHDHMVCVECGKVIEFTCKEIEEMQKRVCRQYRFQPYFHDHRLFGKCSKCQ